MSALQANTKHLFNIWTTSLTLDRRCIIFCVCWVVSFVWCTANTTHRPDVGPMLARRLRRRANIGPTLGQCVVFAGWCDDTPPYRFTCIPWPRRSLGISVGSITSLPQHRHRDLTLARRCPLCSSGIKNHRNCGKTSIWPFLRVINILKANIKMSFLSILIVILALIL